MMILMDLQSNAAFFRWGSAIWGRISSPRWGTNNGHRKCRGERSSRFRLVSFWRSGAPTSTDSFFLSAMSDLPMSCFHHELHFMIFHDIDEHFHQFCLVLVREFGTGWYSSPPDSKCSLPCWIAIHPSGICLGNALTCCHETTNHGVSTKNWCEVNWCTSQKI